MYLCTCGFMCDNSNVYNICNIQTNSECTTPYSNAYTSKYDRYKFTKAVTLLQRLHSSTTHWIQQSVCWVCGGTQRNAAKRLYTGTQYVVVVTGHSDKMLSKAHVWRYTTVQGKHDTFDAVVALEPALLWYESYTPVNMRSSARSLLQKLCRAIPSAQWKMLYHTGQG